MIRQPPRFEKFQASSERASRALSGSKSVDTKCEVLLRSRLWKQGFRFRKNVRDLPGKPDIVFPRERVAVFCDGDFWHGRNWNKRRKQLERGSNSVYWLAKIKANMARDKKHDKELARLGWSFLHVWESDILADPNQIAAKVADYILAKRQENKI